MITVRIGTERPYDVLIGPGLLPAGGEWIRRVHAPCRAAVISDSRVFRPDDDPAFGMLVPSLRGNLACVLVTSLAAVCFAALVNTRGTDHY